MADVFTERVIEAGRDTVEAALGRPEEWLEEAAVRAGDRGRAVDAEMRAEFGRGAFAIRLSRRVRFEVGTPTRTDATSVFPITWEASGFAGLFPVMDALLEVRAAGPGRSRIVFWGRYDPPLGRTGEVIDRFIAHRVAWRSVSSLLDAIAERVEEEHIATGRSA